MADVYNVIAQVNEVNAPSILTANGTVLAAKKTRGGFLIQNVGTNPLFVRLGGTASATEYHAVIKGGTVNDDGLGGSFSQSNGTVYTGIVSVFGTSPRYVVLEM